MARRRYDRLYPFDRMIPGFGQMSGLPIIQRYNPLGAIQYQQALMPGLLHSPIECNCLTCPLAWPHTISDCPSYHRCDNNRRESTSSFENNEHRRGIIGKTKDIAIRNKSFAVRASYCQDQPKFEKDLVSFMDKKSQDVIPDRIIDHLVSFINKDDYHNVDPLDEITLCILSSNVGAKSVMEHSLNRIIKGRMDLNIHEGNVVDIILTIMMSSDVPDKLNTWLHDYLKENWDYIHMIPDFLLKIVDECPGVYLDLERMMFPGYIPERDTKRGRVICP